MGDIADLLGLGGTPPHPYGDAPVRRPVGRSHRPLGRVARAGLTVGALVVGFALTAAFAAGRTAATEADARRAQLVDLVKVRQEHVDALRAQLEGMRAEVSEAENRAAAGLPAFRAELAAVEAAVGLRGVTGPGVRITLTDGSVPCPTGRPEDCRIQDVDLQLAVNTLFALGAEAIAINGERIVATTAIRNAGGAVLVNYSVLTPPYVLEALGQPGALRGGFGDSQLAADFEIWRETYGLGLRLETVEELQVPEYSGSVRLRKARVTGQNP